MARPRSLAVALAIATFLLYAPTLCQPFLTYDDPDYVTDNRVVQAGVTAEGIRWAFAEAHASNWHPITWLSHMLDCAAFGLNAGGHHLINVLLHIANTLLLFALLLRLTHAPWRAAIVAALFAWHPLHVESVAWISERKDVLSAFFGLLAIIAYVEARNARILHAGSGSILLPDRDQDGPGTRRQNACATLALLFFALGLMAKPMLVTLPFVLLLLDHWPLQRTQSTSFRRLALEKWPFFLLTILSCIVTYRAQRAEAVLSLEQHPLALRLSNALIAYGQYLLKAIWPAKLSIVYPLPRETPVWQTALAAAVLGGISWAAWRMRRSHPYVLIGWLWFLGMLVPVIGLVQVGAQAMADRYTYLPLTGVFIAAVYGLADLAARWRIAGRTVAAAAIAVLLGCIAIADAQLRHWTDSEALFSHAIAVTKDNALAHANLGFALMEKHQADRAREHLETAVKLQPAHTDAHNNLGIVLFQRGQVTEAIGHYETVLKFKPENAKAHFNLANARLRQGRAGEAIRHYEAAIAAQPDHPGARNNLAWILATAPQASLRNGARALALAEEVARIAGGNRADVINTLAAACAEAGDFSRAAMLARQALDQANDPALARSIQAQLEGYQAGRPFRDVTLPSE